MNCHGPAHSAWYMIEMEEKLVGKTHESSKHPKLTKLCQNTQQLHHFQGPDCVSLKTEQKLRQICLDRHEGGGISPSGLQLSPHLQPHLVCDSSIISLCYQAWLSSKWAWIVSGSQQSYPGASWKCKEKLLQNQLWTFEMLVVELLTNNM